MEPSLVKEIDTATDRIDTAAYRRRTLRFLLLICAFKIFLAFYLELGNDEAYYWLYSQHLQWNYFDHPPMVALWIRIFTANLSLDAGGFIRLGSVVGSALSAWFLYRAVALVHSERAGWLAAVLYHSSFYAGITAGLYILPDSPQMVFWTGAMWLMALVEREPDRWRHWLLFGLVSGLCIMSKVHGVFLWAGMGGYAIFYQRGWLRRPQIYVAALVTLVLISPIIFWNIHYDFITYKFHSSRVTVRHFAILWKSFLREAASQLGFNNPVNVVLIVTALAAWWRRRRPFPPVFPLYGFTGLPLALVLLCISLFRDTTLPHWSGPAYVSLLPFAAVALAQKSKSAWPVFLRWSFALFLIVLAGWTVIVKAFPGTWGSKLGEDYGRGDISLDMYGWEHASEQFGIFYRQQEAEGKAPAGLPLVATHWWGAHVDYYFARPLGQPLIGLGQPRLLNHYLWTNRLHRDRLKSGEAYCIIPSDDHTRLPYEYFDSARRVAVIPIERSGSPAHYFFVYRLSGLKKPAPEIEEK